MFQSTRPRRARPYAAQMRASCGRFQSTRPRRARPCRYASTVTQAGFQSTRPRRARHTCSISSVVSKRFQSTRPRRARLSFFGICAFCAIVSIHAPAEGATEHLRSGELDLIVSIHAPAEGATETAYARYMARAVSIHAPAEGATTKNDHQTRRYPGFNPRARGGRDHCTAAGWPRHARFNPRARGGRDHCQFTAHRQAIWFQSTRPRRARPGNAPARTKHSQVSIHAPAEGATVAWLLCRRNQSVSIHAPAEGAT